MEKILLALNAENPNPHALDFACYLANLTKSVLTGVFLENLVVDEIFVLNEDDDSKGSTWQIDKSNEKYRDRQRTIAKNIELFKSACEKRSVRYKIHGDCGDPSKEIIRESRFADIIVLDAETTFNNGNEGVPSDFVKSVLKEAECPVIVAPESFEGIDEIILTYNRSKSSVFAIKQFCYLFPQFDEKKITVLHINEENEAQNPDDNEFHDWISSHYSAVGFENLNGDAEIELFAKILKKRNTMVVMGAYGRSALSQFFKHSRADLLIKTITQAIFITHS